MADPYPIRPVSADEFAAFRAVDEHAFHVGPLSEAELPVVQRLFEFGRSLAAVDESRPSGAGGIVGTAGAFSFQFAVPGAVVPAAGVSYVSVLPHYRRRGILRSMMRRQLADIAGGGESIAVLWASEAPLYGRYGYGRASRQQTMTLRRGDGALAAHAPSDPSLTLRLAAPGDVVPDLAKVYDTVLASQPGFFARDDAWWDRVLFDPESERRGYTPVRCVLAEDASGARGYALYRGLNNWETGTNLPDGKLAIRELVAADPAATALLWRDLLSRDLVSEVTVRMRPDDDPLVFMLADPRRARVQVTDALWVRIVALADALARRAYSCPVDVVLEVTDAILPDNAGRWRLRATGDGVGEGAGEGNGNGDGHRDGTGGVRATCERTDDRADLALDIRELGAAYLGGTRLGALAGAGLVREYRPGSVAALSAAMSWDPAPWCPVIF
jgi:predicted acetyltransferase